MATTTDLIDSRAAWLRLVAALALSTIGGVGMWSVVVALPAIQAEFGVTRAAASFPYTLTMLGFGVGGIMMGRLSDRLRRSIAAGRCHMRAGDRLRRSELVVQLVDVRDRARCADRHARQLRQLWSVAGGHFALVLAAARARSFDRRFRQLSGGRCVAADRAVPDRNRRLANGALVHRRDLPADDVAADLCNAALHRRMQGK